MIFKYLAIFFSFILIGSCHSNSDKSSKNKVVYAPSLQDTFFLSEMWSYPSFTIKDENGKFDSAMEGELDTTHLLHTANIFSAYDTLHDTDRKSVV